MSAQDLEQRARELLAAEWANESSGASCTDITNELKAELVAIRAIVAALRQQPAPVDLEQFREAVECWGSHRRSGRGDPRVAAEAKRLLAIIDSHGKVCPCGEATCTESWEPGCGLGESVEHAVPAEREPPRGDELRAILARQPAPVVDDGNGVRACPVLIAARAQGVQS